MSADSADAYSSTGMDCGVVEEEFDRWRFAALPVSYFVRWRRGAAHGMTKYWGNLRIAVVDDEIIVSLPGTSYGVTYFKRGNSPQLLAKHISNEDDFRTPLRLSDFLSRAWRMANDKARELGWIV
jgi:hypothetical protein